MTTDQVLVIVAGLAAIAWVNWYFLWAGRSRPAVAAVGGAGIPEVRIRVVGGYEPSQIQVARGRPVRLVFDRQETSGCSEELVIPDFGIRRYLPPHEETTIELVPETEGSYEFTCGMGMLRGRLTVVNEEAEG